MEKFLKKLGLLPLLFCAMVSCFALTACGDDDDDDDSDVPSNASAIIGKWGIEGYVDGDYVTSTMEFKKDGTVTIQEISRDYPEDNYKVTVKYNVVGDLSSGANLYLTGRTADGDNYNQTYIATVSGNKLTLVGVGGEANGERLVLTKK